MLEIGAELEAVTSCDPGDIIGNGRQLVRAVEWPPVREPKEGRIGYGLASGLRVDRGENDVGAKIVIVTGIETRQTERLAIGSHKRKIIESGRGTRVERRRDLMARLIPNVASLIRFGRKVWITGSENPADGMSNTVANCPQPPGADG